jgi:Fis family transcriptional regulator
MTYTSTSSAQVHDSRSLPAEVPPPPASGTSLAAPPAGRPTLDDDWPTLAVLSRRYIGRALEHTGGNKTRAADLLGIDRRTLNRILARERARQAAANGAASR